MPFSTLAVLVLVYASLSNAQAFNCEITIPPNPLTAQGLATPYKVTGCDQTQFENQGSFIEAAILDTTTGAIQIYHPLLINQDSNTEGVDFIAPVVPTIAANSVVGIWFGSNAATVKLVGTTQGCVNGLGNSVFGQFAYCNAPEFFTAAQTAISSGLLKIPPPGTSTKGGTKQACPVLRDFRIVDMDQSDNVDTTYLLIGGKKLAQNTDANAAANKNSEVLSNGSDNALVNDFVAPALGCTPFTAPSITAPGNVSGGLALNELQANSFPPAAGPALVPLNDDFTVINNNGAITQSLAKTNLYRAGVGQPQAADNANASGTTYCQSYAASGIFIAQNEALFTAETTPAAAVANNLFTFMANRFATSFGPVPSLGCSTIFGVDIANIVKQTVNGNGVVTAATIDTATLQKILDGTIKAGSSSSAATSTTAVKSSTRARSKTVSSASASSSLATKVSSQTALTTTAKAISKSSASSSKAGRTSVAATGTTATSVVSTTASTAVRGRPTRNAEGNKGGNNVFNRTLKARNIWA